MNRFTSGVRMKTFWIGFSGPNQTTSPIRLAPLSPTVKPQLSWARLGSPTTSICARVADAEAGLVRQPDVRDGERVEAHHLRRDGVDRHLVAGAEDDVLDLREHGARAGAVAGGGAVHHGEEAAVDLLLDRQQVHQRLVDPAMRVVAARVEQAAEGVLHRAGRRGVDVAVVDDQPVADERIGARYRQVEQLDAVSSERRLSTRRSSQARSSLDSRPQLGD